MSDKKQLTLMSQFSIIRESPAGMLHHHQPTKHHQQQKNTSSTELKFKIEPIGIQPEDDDDLETCPSRTRSSWPHQIVPWWKPADRFEKPPYSYATLIAHAILTSKDGRLTLSDIYKWISEAYPYYKRGQKGWQNSIRHNLSLNKKWFIKVDRRPTQAHPGKGGYWTLQMNMEKIFVDNLSQAGGHSRRHHDMGMYANLSTQYYRSASSGISSDDACQDDDLDQQDVAAATQFNLCPNIHITRPEDYEGGNANKKSKASSNGSNVISAPRIRNMTSQEKDAVAAAAAVVEQPVEVITPPKTDPKNFIIRFNPSSEPSVSNKRKARPSPKSGKRRNPVEPGSSTAEEDDQDSAVDVESYTDNYPTSKKRKATTTKSIDTITASLPNARVETSYTLGYSATTAVSHNANTRPSDLIDQATNSNLLGFNNNDFWMYDEDAVTAPAPASNTMLLTSEYPSLLFDVEAQNILQGLTSTAPAPAPVPVPAPVQQNSVMRTINLQFNALEKNIHYPNTMMFEDFSDTTNDLFISNDLSCYNLEQYVDFGGASSVLDNQKPPSDVLMMEDEAAMMLNTYWPTDSGDGSCYMNFAAAVSSSNDSSLPTSMP